MMMNGTGFETRAKIDGGGGVIYRSFAGKGGINGTEKGEVYSHISYENFVVELVHFEVKRRKNYRIPGSKTLTFL
jgi:hypothetical protein